MMQQIPLILIGGPTASGKSGLAMQIARQKNGCIINTDAMQIYAGLSILTAQPSARDKAEIPHLLYEVLDAAEASSAGKWLTLARAAIDEARQAGRTPILVGGTGMYFSSLLGGLADIPLIPDEARQEATKLYEAVGEENFRKQLAARDLESAARIARNDRQRLIRAYEVVTHTGKSLGAWYKQGQVENKFSTEWHLLMPPREELYAACDKRFLTMIENGAIEEVQKLLARDLSSDLPAMKILGVREIGEYLRGETTLDAVITKAQQMTRNYAKRQMTWFRNQGFETQ